MSSKINYVIHVHLLHHISFLTTKKLPVRSQNYVFFLISLINVYAFHRYSCYHFYFIHTTAKRGKIRRNITCLFSQYFALLIYLSFYENLFFLGEYGGSGKIVLSIISSTLSWQAKTFSNLRCQRTFLSRYLESILQMFLGLL